MIVTVNTDDLASVSMLAAELRVNRSTVAMWAARRETNHFPEPVLTVGERVKLYSRREVHAWLAD